MYEVAEYAVGDILNDQSNEYQISAPHAAQKFGPKLFSTTYQMQF